MAGQGVDTGTEFGPTRKDYEEAHYTAGGTDTGQNHGPDRYDYEKKQEAEKIKAQVQRREDIQKTRDWKETKKRNEDAIRKAERQREKEAAEREKAKKNKRGRLGNRKPGIELPKQGLRRLGYASRDLGGSITGASPVEFGGYGDAFSMMGAESGLHLSIGNNRGRGVDFGMYSSPFGGLGEALTSNGKARGFGGYQDPFARAAPKKKGKRGRPRKRSLYSLGLF